MTDRDRDPEPTAADTAAAQQAAGARRKSRRGNTGGKLATLLRRSESNRHQEYKRDDPMNDSRSVEHRLKGPSSSKLSFLDFVCNVKKHLLLKNLCKSNKKSKETETTTPCSGTKQNNVISVIESLNACQKQELTNGEQASSDRRLLYENRLSDVLENSCHSIKENVANIGMQYGTTGTNLHTVPIRQQNKSISDVTTDSEATQPTYSDATVAVSNAIADIPSSVNEILNNEHKVKASLAKELLNLSKYGWYWGPISGDEADAKLISEPDGAFLVRDSSDDRYVLTLSFKSSGKMLHARMEHTGGLFSLCNQSTENEGFTSVAALINHSMNFSQSAVICYSRPKYPGYPSFPVRLTKPVSRFTQVRSLQYLCRFVIRQYIRLDNIHKLPLPKTIKGYIQEAHY
ncbi:suppressor of cytokine signaling 4 [Solenopsis invicta]|uniref:suppressor of cytokine signaling 4 n=1 Tax=Solenopsis invicta TaxID=13686 RepID=UPI00193E4450|nr:suppressor of cytokine signaling 4 [Solenopsis invicta]